MPIVGSIRGLGRLVGPNASSERECHPPTLGKSTAGCRAFPCPSRDKRVPSEQLANAISGTEDLIFLACSPGQYHLSVLDNLDSIEWSKINHC